MRLVGQDAEGGSSLALTEAGDPFLKGSKCPTCGDVRYPARELCPNDLVPCEPTRLDGLGTLYVAVRVDLAPPGFEAPLWVGYVDLDAGVRVFSQIATQEGLSPKNGDRLEMSFGVIRRLPEIVHGTIFEPVGSETSH